MAKTNTDPKKQLKKLEKLFERQINALATFADDAELSATTKQAIREVKIRTRAAKIAAGEAVLAIDKDQYESESKQAE